jgi:hypothetical protein
MGILRVRVPYYRRKTAGTLNGLGTFFLLEEPSYLPEVGQTVIITHTNVPNSSGLLSKLTTISTNTVSGLFQSYEVNTDSQALIANDNYSNFFIIQYSDVTFSSNQFAGDCTGYIEYDVDPDTYQVLKPIETAVVVNEMVPYDLDEGKNEVYCNYTDVVVSGETAMPALFIKRNDTNSIFTNLLTSLNLPVSEADLKKYGRSPLGNLVESGTGTIVKDGVKYVWNETNTPGNGATTGVVHPTEGYVGEYFNTVLQNIAMTEETNQYGQKTGKLIPHDLYLIIEIPQNQYGEIIDGKSVFLTLPYSGSTDELIEIYGTYNESTLDFNLDRILSDKDLSMQTLGAKPDLTKSTSEYESNCVLLFSDKIKRPGGSLDSDVEWSDGYTELYDGIPVFKEEAQRKYTYDYRLDECVGVAYLDKGFIVITHPTIVDNIFENYFGGSITEDSSSSDLYTFKSYYFEDPESSSNEKTGHVITVPSKMIRTLNDDGHVKWDSTQFIFNNDGGAGSFDESINPSLQFISYNSEKSLNIVCLASSDEFFRSTNSTAKELLDIEEEDDFASFKTDGDQLYPVLISEIGLHDVDGNLLAVCKPIKPIEKNWYDVVSFSIKVRL